MDLRNFSWIKKTFEVFLSFGWGVKPLSFISTLRHFLIDSFIWDTWRHRSYLWFNYRLLNQQLLQVFIKENLHYKTSTSRLGYKHIKQYIFWFQLLQNQPNALLLLLHTQPPPPSASPTFQLQWQVALVGLGEHDSTAAQKSPTGDPLTGRPLPSVPTSAPAPTFADALRDPQVVDEGTLWCS